jgi:hypothetical protein
VLIESKQEGGKLQAVLLEGPVDLITGPRQMVREIASRIYLRYLGPEGINDADPQSWLRDPANLLVRLTPDRVISW